MDRHQVGVKESTKLTIQKITGILKPLDPFLKDRGIVYLKDAKTEHLSALQNTWVGRLRKDRTTGEFIRQPKRQLGKQKKQEFVKMFFRRARELRWIPENPAELLLPVKMPKIDVKKKTPEVGRTLAPAIENQQLMPDQHGFGHYRPESTRPPPDGPG
jgi:hypothetical protein